MSIMILVIDMINDFCDPQGKLFVPDSHNIIEPIKQQLQQHPSVFVNDAHSYEDRQLKDFGLHATTEWGCEIIPALVPFAKKRVTKRTFDGFHHTALSSLLKLHKVTDLIITGLVANICVLATVQSAYIRGYTITVPSQCVAALSYSGMKILEHQVKQVYKGQWV